MVNFLMFGAPQIAANNYQSAQLRKADQRAMALRARQIEDSYKALCKSFKAELAAIAAKEDRAEIDKEVLSKWQKQKAFVDSWQVPFEPYGHEAWAKLVTARKESAVKQVLQKLVKVKKVEKSALDRIDDITEAIDKLFTDSKRWTVIEAFFIAAGEKGLL